MTHIPSGGYHQNIYVHGDDKSDGTTTVLVAVALTSIFITNLVFISKLYIHLLVYLYENKFHRLLKFFTCCGCLCSQATIKQKYYVEDNLVADQDSSGDE